MAAVFVIAAIVALVIFFGPQLLPSKVLDFGSKRDRAIEGLADASSGNKRISSNSSSKSNDNTGKDVEKWRVFVLQAPPPVPPEVSLVTPTRTYNEFKSNSKNTNKINTYHKGDLLYYYWFVDQELRTREPTPPINWPKTVNTYSSESAYFDLDTETMPQYLEVRLYSDVGSNGVPKTEGARTLTCFSGVVKGNSECAVNKKRDLKSRKWLIEVPKTSCKRKCYVAMYADWGLPKEVVDKRGNRISDYSASWIFSLNFAE